MTNTEKAKELALKNWVNGGVYAASKASALEMAKWKDHQFKEYLEKKKDDADMWSEEWAVFHGLTCTMHKIINELFKED